MSSFKTLEVIDIEIIAKWRIIIMNKYQRKVIKIAKKWSVENKESLRFTKILARQFLKRNWKQYRIK